MDPQLAAFRNEQARKFELQRLQGGRDDPPLPSHPAGKVVCGKWFATPPTRLTVKEMEALLAAYVRITPQKEPFISQVRMDTDSAEFFQTFLQRAQFMQHRMGYMLGTFDPTTKAVQVDCIYEPAQHSTPQGGVEELPDPLLEKVLQMAEGFGLKPVGWIFSHPSKRSYFLSAAEVLKTAEMMAKYGPHCVVVTVSPIAETRQTDFHPFCVSQQCATIFQEGTLHPHPSEPHLVHSDRELEAVKEEQAGRAQVTRQATHDVDTALFTLPVPITAFQTKVFRSRFSRLNRPDYRPTLREDVGRLLQTRKGEPMHQVLRDFHLLVFLLEAEFLHLDDVPSVAAAFQAQSDASLDRISTGLKSLGQRKRLRSESAFERTLKLKSESAPSSVNISTNDRSSLSAPSNIEDMTPRQQPLENTTVERSSLSAPANIEEMTPRQQPSENTTVEKSSLSAPANIEEMTPRQQPSENTTVEVKLLAVAVAFFALELWRICAQ